MDRYEVDALPTVTVPKWRKSSRCGGSTTCVEVAAAPGAVLVRDSAHSGGPRLALSVAAWRALAAQIKGEARQGRAS